MTTVNEASGAERSPLLGRRPCSELDSANNEPSPSLLKEHVRLPVYTIALLLGSLALLLLGESFQEPAFGEIEEGIFCREYYTNVTDSATDPRCKNDRVQSDIAMLDAVEATIRFVVSLVTSIPYGMAAERVGRRRILSLSMFGMALRYPLELIVFKFFPIRFIWIMALTTFIGGGHTVFSALLYTMISDITSPSQRSMVYFYISAILVGTPLFGHPAGYLAMKWGPWFSSYLSITCYVIAFLLTLSVPETINIANLHKSSLENNATIDRNLPSENVLSSPTLKLLSSVRNGLISVRVLVWDNKRLSIILFSTLLTRIGGTVNPMLMQYIAKRFSMRWAEANLVTTIKYLTKLILVLFILPFISQLLLRARVSPLAKDLLVARCCIVVTAIGTFGIALATTPAMLFAFLVPFAFLEGFNASVKSLLAQLAEDGQTAILFTAVGALESVGTIVAVPAMASIFGVGLRWGEQWYGLVFVLAGLMFSIAAMIVLGVRLHGQDRVEQESEATIGAE